MELSTHSMATPESAKTAIHMDAKPRRPRIMAMALMARAKYTFCQATRAVRAAMAVGCGFMVANLFCWLMNRWFVFRPGRHVWYVEFLLFFTVSLAAFGVGVGLQTLLIHAAGVMTTVAFLAEVFSSLVINFVVRKFFVFKG